MTEKFLIFILPLLLMGCAALPAPLVVIGQLHTGIDLFSLFTTGKTTTDHAISKVLDKDCALLRFVKGEKICSATNEEMVIIMDKLGCDIFTFDNLGNPSCKPVDINDEF